MGIDGSQERVLHPNEEKSPITDLGWSPDSQQVVAAFYDTGGESRDLESVSVRIVTVSVADGSTRVLKSLTPEENAGVWPQRYRRTRQGHEIAFGVNVLAHAR